MAELLYRVTEKEEIISTEFPEGGNTSTKGPPAPQGGMNMVHRLYNSLLPASKQTENETVPFRPQCTVRSCIAIFSWNPANFAGIVT